MPGCFTCKDRKKKCDCLYALDETSGSHKCNTCIKHGIPCYMDQPTGWAADPEQKQAQRLERKRLVKLGKRKSREESDSSGIMSRDRSMTLVSQEPSVSHPAIYPSIERPTNGQSESLHMTGQPSEQVLGGQTARRELLVRRY